MVDETWCFDHWAARLRSLPLDMAERDWPPPGWTLYKDETWEIVYAPFDWTNETAQVALVGITPGRHQGWVATMQAADALRHGASPSDALQRAKSVASFSGPMRRNLVTMLDAIGLDDILGLGSCAELFGSAHELATHLSALAFPVFIDRRNYTGAKITREPVFVALIQQVLAAQLLQAPRALIVPLGQAAADAVGLLVADGVIDAERCLWGFPHPSGANGHRHAQFERRRRQLQSAVTSWYVHQPPRD